VRYTTKNFRSGRLALLFLGCLLLAALTVSCGSSSTHGLNGGGGGGPTAWSRVSTQPPNLANASFLLIDDAGNLYVSAEQAGGMYISRDHGSSWNALNNGFVNDCHDAMVLNGAGEVLASDMSHSNVSGCASLPNHLYRLPSRSTTWLQASPGFSGFGQWPFYTSPTGRVFAGGEAGGSVYISTDGGSSYAECLGCPSIFSPTTTAETFDLKPGPGGYLYVATARMGVFYSTDNGDHWTQMPCNGGLSCAGGSGQASDTKALGVTPGGSLLIARDIDQGSVACYGPQPPPNGSWTRCDAGLAPGSGNHPNAVIADISGIWLNSSGSRVFLAANSGGGHVGNVYSSTDGVHWSTDNSGLPSNPNALNFTVDPSTGLLYVLVKGSGIYHTQSPP